LPEADKLADLVISPDVGGRSYYYSLSVDHRNAGMLLLTPSEVNSDEFQNAGRPGSTESISTE